MLRRDSQASLETLRLDGQQTGAFVLERPDRSPSARELTGAGVAAKIIDTDESSQQPLDLESACTGTFARQHPVANVRRSIAAGTPYLAETEPELRY